MPSFRCLSCVWEGFEYFVLYLYIKRLQSWKCASLCEQIYLTFNKLLILPSFPLLSGMQNNKGCKATHSLKRANENNDIAIYSLSLSLLYIYLLCSIHPSLLNRHVRGSSKGRLYAQFVFVYCNYSILTVCKYCTAELSARSFRPFA